MAIQGGVKPFKIGNEVVTGDAAKALEKLSHARYANKTLKDHMVTDASVANALLNRNIDGIIDEHDLLEINGSLPAGQKLTEREFYSLAIAFEDRFPKSGREGFIGLTPILRNRELAARQALGSQKAIPLDPASLLIMKGAMVYKRVGGGANAKAVGDPKTLYLSPYFHPNSFGDTRTFEGSPDEPIKLEPNPYTT